MKSEKVIVIREEDASRTKADARLCFVSDTIFERGFKVLSMHKVVFYSFIKLNMRP